MKFTQASVDRFKMPVGKSEHIEFDEMMHGFGLRVRANGKSEHRTFIAQYKIGAKHRRVTIGNTNKITLENAKAEAKRIFGKVANGKDPAAEKEAFRKSASHTFGATVGKYLEAREKQLRSRSYDAAERYLTSHWAALHGLVLDGITRAHVAAEVRAIAKKSGPSAANRARASLSAFFRWAIGEGLCDNNPVLGTNTQSENGPRERSLSDAEAAAVWLAAPENDYGRILKLLLLTGCRRVEVGDLQWLEIDLEAHTITLPPARTKNGREHVVPLCDAALAILKGIPRRDRELVFGIGQGGFSGWAKSKRNLDKTVQFKARPWTLHDIRRTVRTGMGMLGVLPHVAEAALNHLPPKLIRTYDRNTYATEKRAALDLWANHLAVAIAKADGANVAVLRKA